MKISFLKNTNSLYILSGILLFLVLCIALVIANSSIGLLYENIIETPIYIGISSHAISKPAVLWVNEGLMSAFFMLLSIELKQSLVSKNKMDKNLISMPSIAAFGGIFLSTVIYLLINHNNAAAQHGFGIVTTTDTAVVLCILTALGNRIPKNLRLFMLLLSAIDDILAIFIIAIFYTSSLSLVSILLALSGVCVLFILNRFRVFKLTPYLLVGVFIWFCVLQSGIHATLAGAIIGLCIPLSKNKKQTNLILLKKNLKYLRPLQISG